MRRLHTNPASTQHDYSVPNSVIASGYAVDNSLVLADVNGDKKLNIVFLTGGSAVANTDGALRDAVVRAFLPGRSTRLSRTHR